MKTKKSVLSRMAAVFFALFTMAVMLCTTTVSASAAEVETVPSSAAASVEIGTVGHTFKLSAPGHTPNHIFSPVMLAAGAVETEEIKPAAAGSSEAAYQSTIEFFTTWIRRIGMMIAFVGAIMFALAIKNNDAEQKQAGLITMISGFIVAALCAASSMFNLFG